MWFPIPPIMEAKIVEKLRFVSATRRNAVEFLQLHVPAITHLETNWVFHSVCGVTTVSLVTALYLTTRSMSLFSFHPLCMIFACCFFIPEGIVAYKNHFLLESLSPIMQHTKRVKVRAIHQTMQMLGLGLMLMGFLFILAEKMELHKTIIPGSFHSISATTLILAIVFQAMVGQEKLQYHATYSTNRRIRRWHGDMGLLLWDCVCLTLISGLASFVPFSIYSFIAYLCPFLLWLAVMLQLIGKNAIKDEELDGDTTGDIMASAGTSIPLTKSNDGVDGDYGLRGDFDEEDMDESTSGLLANGASPTRRRSHANLAGQVNDGPDNYTVERPAGEDTTFNNDEEDGMF